MLDLELELLDDEFSTGNLEGEEIQPDDDLLSEHKYNY